MVFKEEKNVAFSSFEVNYVATSFGPCQGLRIGFALRI